MKILWSMEIPKIVNFVNHDNSFELLTPVKYDLVVVDMNCEDSKRFLIEV